MVLQFPDKRPLSATLAALMRAKMAILADSVLEHYMQYSGFVGGALTMSEAVVRSRFSPVPSPLSGSDLVPDRVAPPCPTILCVDDDPVILDLQRALLEAAGFAVITANSPRKALRVFSEKRPDAAVLDYAMPAMSGAGVAARMRQLCSAIPLILNTGSIEIPKKEAALFDHILSKGLAPILLLSVLRAIFPTAKPADIQWSTD
jgi:CheY-like chemotaxis protein